MDFLKAEIERKKRQLAEKNVVGPNKKYFKRGDLMEKEREEYFKKLKPKEEDVKHVVDLHTKEKDKSKGKIMRFFVLRSFVHFALLLCSYFELRYLSLNCNCTSYCTYAPNHI